MNTYERNCRRLIRAYPPRYRKARGEELVGTLLELAEPGRDRPTLRDSLDVVRGGLALRLRERPPEWRLALYRLFRVRLPAQYLGWVRDDLAGRFRVEREYLWAILAVLLPLLLLDELTGLSDGVLGPRVYNGLWFFYMGFFLAFGYLVARSWGETSRRRMLSKHGLRPEDSPGTGRSRAARS